MSPAAVPANFGRYQKALAPPFLTECLSPRFFRLSEREARRKEALRKYGALERRCAGDRAFGFPAISEDDFGLLLGFRGDFGARSRLYGREE
eukprot:scaffold1088_cov247-Pinguiococcus_pyrenoidosus.AAC.6